jgi:hypothetical protein
LLEVRHLDLFQLQINSFIPIHFQLTQTILIVTSDILEFYSRYNDIRLVLVLAWKADYQVRVLKREGGECQPNWVQVVGDEKSGFVEFRGRVLDIVEYQI